MTTLTEQAETVAKSRYYLKNSDGAIVEDEVALFRRVAMAIASIEREYNTIESKIHLLTKEFEAMMANLEFLPNSPTLMNAGTGQGTYSACFVLPLEDSMDGIMKSSFDRSS